MKLRLSNQVQHKIADLMWAAKDMDEINRLLHIFGKDGHIVYNMILAHAFDEVMDTDIANKVLDNIFHR